MKLHEIEELIKNAERSAMKAMLRHATIISNPASSQEEKDQARDNILAIAAEKPVPKKLKTTKESKTELDSAIGDAKQKKSANTNSKIQANIASANNKQINNKADVAAERASQKAAERKKQLLPGSEHTLQELESHVKRTTKDPNEFTPKEVDQTPPTPEHAAKILQNKRASTVQGAIDLAHDLHSDGDVDSAHKLLSAVPKEYMPPELKNYNPAYIHYGITPDRWKNNPEHHEAAHEFHNQIMTGVHDNSEDVPTRAMAAKVKNLAKPIAS